MKIDILLTIMLCNAIDAPHKSVKQNFNFSFYLGFMQCFWKIKVFFLEKDIFDQWMLKLLSNLGK